MFSCVRYKNFVLVNDNLHGSHDTTTVIKEVPYLLQKNDVLNISVASTDEKSIAIFIKNAAGSSNLASGESSLYLNGYVINDSGRISLPVIGDIEVENKTTSEVRRLLQQKLITYFKYAIVDVKLVSFRVSFLGEFNGPGSITVFRNQLNLLDALSLAGGFTSYSKRTSVKIMREVNGKMKTKRVDFTNPDIVNHDWYYLKPNDIIYAEPLRIKPLTTNTATFSLVLSTVSFIILILNFSRSNR